MTTPYALLRCPFCGGEAKHYHRPDMTGWSNTDWVSCSDDDCGVSTAMEETKAGAIAAWNRRAGQAHAAGLLEALEGMLYAVCHETGFAAAVRHDSGRAYPWAPLEIAEERARAAIAAAKGE